MASSQHFLYRHLVVHLAFGSVQGPHQVRSMWGIRTVSY